MNFEVLNQIIEKAASTSLDVVSAEIAPHTNHASFGIAFIAVLVAVVAIRLLDKK